MRILHVTDTYLPSLGGIERLVDGLAGHQQAAGHQVRIVTRAAGPAVDGVTRDPSRLDEMLAWAEVVHAHVSIVSPLALRAIAAAADAELPVLASVHSMWTHLESVMGLAASAGRWGRRPVLWAPVSTVAAASVRAALGPDAHVEVLPNAVDLTRWRITPDPAPRPVHVAWVGRLVPRKRAHAAVRVLARARRQLDRVDQGLELRATLVGDGWQSHALERQVARHRMQDWTTMAGSLTQPRLADFYQHADIFLSTCTLESFGLAALEARTAGLVVVGRDGTGMADFITDGVDGLLCPADAALASAVARLVADPQELARMRRNAATAPGALDWTELVTRTEDAYRRAAVLVPTRRELVGSER